MSAYMKEALFYESNNGDVTCRLCPVGCVIINGKYGFCGARKNKGGVLYAEQFGRVTAIALDPIEKKPLYRFKSGSAILSIGGLGCNFRCPFCQNHTISMGAAETDALMPADAAALAVKLVQNGNVGIAYTYNEPFINYEYILETSKLVRKQKLSNVIVTNGFVSLEPLRQILPYIDAMNIDLKGYNSRFYSMVNGNLSHIKKVIACAAEKCHVEITTLVIPDENDNISEIENMALWIAELNPKIPLHLTRFFPKYKMADKQPTPVETLEKLAERAAKHLRYVYLGNI